MLSSRAGVLSQSHSLGEGADVLNSAQLFHSASCQIYMEFQLDMCSDFTFLLFGCQSQSLSWHMFLWTHQIQLGCVFSFIRKESWVLSGPVLQFWASSFCHCEFRCCAVAELRGSLQPQASSSLAAASDNAPHLVLLDCPSLSKCCLKLQETHHVGVYRDIALRRVPASGGLEFSVTTFCRTQRWLLFSS